MHRFFYFGGIMEEKRLAIIGISVENEDHVMDLNQILHGYGT